MSAGRRIGGSACLWGLILQGEAAREAGSDGASQGKRVGVSAGRRWGSNIDYENEDDKDADAPNADPPTRFPSPYPGLVIASGRTTF